MTALGRRAWMVVAVVVVVVVLVAVVSSPGTGAVVALGSAGAVEGLRRSRRRRSAEADEVAAESIEVVVDVEAIRAQVDGAGKVDEVPIEELAAAERERLR